MKLYHFQVTDVRVKLHLFFRCISRRLPNIQRCPGTFLEFTNRSHACHLLPFYAFLPRKPFLLIIFNLSLFLSLSSNLSISILVQFILVLKNFYHRRPLQYTFTSFSDRRPPASIPSTMDPEKQTLALTGTERL